MVVASAVVAEFFEIVLVVALIALVEYHNLLISIPNYPSHYCNDPGSNTVHYRWSKWNKGSVVAVVEMLVP